MKKKDNSYLPVGTALVPIIVGEGENYSCELCFFCNNTKGCMPCNKNTRADGNNVIYQLIEHRIDA